MAAITVQTPNGEMPLLGDSSGRLDLLFPSKDNLLLTASLNLKTANDSYKIFDTLQYSSLTVMVSVSKTDASGNGSIALRGYVDVAQTVSTPDLGLINLENPQESCRRVIRLKPGSDTESFILQLDRFDFTALEFYVKSVDSGTAATASLYLTFKGAH